MTESTVTLNVLAPFLIHKIGRDDAWPILKKQARFVLLTSSSGYNLDMKWDRIKKLSGMKSVQFDTILTSIDKTKLNMKVINTKTLSTKKEDDDNSPSKGKKVNRKAKSKKDRDAA